MKISYLLLLILMISCSSTGKYTYTPPYGNLKLKTASFIDANEQRFVTRQYYLNTEEIYKKHIDSGQINKLKKWSCFNNDESVNYISILKRYVPIFRTLATTQKFKIKYKKVDTTRDVAHTRVYTEEKMDKISVESKACWVKDDNGVSHKVISELYK